MMAQTKTLIEIEYHTDSETGIYGVGEADYSIKVGPLSDYLKRYGAPGLVELENMIDVVKKRIASYLPEQDTK